MMARLFLAVAMCFTATAAYADNITVYSAGSVAIGETRQLTAYVPLSPNTVTWTVNDIPGGNEAVGTVSAKGLYKAPMAVPTNAAVSVKAASTAYAEKFNAVTITVTQPPVQLWSISPSSGGVGTLKISLNGSNFTKDSVVKVGDVALATTYVSPTSLKAVGTATAEQVGKSLGVKVVNAGLGGTVSGSVTYKVTSVTTPPPSDPTTPTPAPTPTPTPTPTPPDPGTGLGTGNLGAARLLEQATFGPTPDSIARVQQLGVTAWLDEQFNKPETPIADPGAMNSGTVKAQYLSRLSMADDQLRQRVAYALGQVIVISMNKNIYPNEIIPYLQILSRNAFGNYRTLLGDISTSAQMGKYLDIAHNTKPGPGGAANENYARELIQLFTIGLMQLNADGSPALDSNGKTVATYDQAMIQQVALVFTGWTYVNNAWEDFSGPMVPRDANHDTRAKAFLGCSLAAGQTTTADLNAALDCIFAHPNVAPFIATRLIRTLVTSNPSPAYVARVAAVFNNNGAGVKGDLKATVRAILTDADARNDQAPTNSGRLRDPTLHLTALVRALNGNIKPANQLSWQMSQIGEEPLTPPSVFGFFSPGYRIPRSTLVGPEFQIYSPTDAVLRGNLFWQAITNPSSDFTVDLSSFTSAGSVGVLIDRVDQALLYGRMPQAMRQSLATSLAAQDAASRVPLALYLTALSGLHAVQY